MTFRKYYTESFPKRMRKILFSYINSLGLINCNLVIIILSRKAEFTYYVIIFVTSRIMQPVVTKKNIVLWPPKYFTVI